MWKHPLNTTVAVLICITGCAARKTGNEPLFNTYADDLKVLTSNKNWDDGGSDVNTDEISSEEKILSSTLDTAFLKSQLLDFSHPYKQLAAAELIQGRVGPSEFRRLAAPVVSRGLPVVSGQVLALVILRSGKEAPSADLFKLLSLAMASPKRKEPFLEAVIGLERFPVQKARSFRAVFLNYVGEVLRGKEASAEEINDLKVLILIAQRSRVIDRIDVRKLQQTGVTTGNFSWASKVFERRK